MEKHSETLSQRKKKPAIDKDRKICEFLFIFPFLTVVLFQGVGGV
jgi:hypothetical protein